MEISEVQKLARRMLDEHVPRWNFATYRYAAFPPAFCFSHGLICMSEAFIELNEEPTIRAFLLHEIVHGLIYTQYPLESAAWPDHGPEFQKMAEKIGAPSYDQVHELTSREYRNLLLTVAVRDVKDLKRAETPVTGERLSCIGKPQPPAISG